MFFKDKENRFRLFSRRGAHYDFASQKFSSITTASSSSRRAFYVAAAESVGPEVAKLHTHRIAAQDRGLESLAEMTTVLLTTGQPISTLNGVIKISKRKLGRIWCEILGFDFVKQENEFESIGEKRFELTNSNNAERPGNCDGHHQSDLRHDVPSPNLRR